MGAADFKVIGEGGSFDLTGEGSKNIKFELEEDVSGSRSVLAFRVKTSGPKLKLKFEINGNDLFEQEFEASERSWHDVVQAGILKKDNTLKVTKFKSTGAASAGKITFSNIALYYQRT
jgi:hypothetical protein